MFLRVERHFCASVSLLWRVISRPAMCLGEQSLCLNVCRVQTKALLQFACRVRNSAQCQLSFSQAQMSFGTVGIQANGLLKRSCRLLWFSGAVQGQPLKICDQEVRSKLLSSSGQFRDGILSAPRS